MSSTHVNRRQVLLAGGAGLMGLLAGCGGGGAVEEIDENVQEGIDHLDATEAPLNTAGNAVHENDWPTCFGGVDEVRGELDSARSSFTVALDLAEENGHSDYAAAIELLIEYTAIHEEIADEMEAACEAGDAGDQAELESRWERVQELDDERHAKREEVEAAFDELEG